MSLIRTLRMVVIDLKLGPRSPVFLWALVMPPLLTFMLQVVFLTLLSPKPRLAILDQGESAITAAVERMEDIELKRPGNRDQLRDLVENNDVDAALVLSEGFDTAVRTGEKPELEFYMAGESLASNRILLAVTALNLIREVEGRAAPVEVVLHTPGGDEVPHISVRIIPSVLIFVLLVSGIFVPAFMLVSEKENRTLDALLITPVQMSEVLLAKALLGFIMVMVMSYLTLALNGALGSRPLGLLAALAVAAVMCIEIGLIYGTMAKDGKSLYTLIKSLNIFLAGPVIFYLFPSWPQWIAKLFPTYWFIDPLYRLSLRGASFSEVWPDLMIALVICIVLVPSVILLGRRMQIKLGQA